MDPFNDLRRSALNSAAGNYHTLSADKLRTSTARMTGANVISSSSDYKKMSEDLDREFATMKVQAEDKRSGLVRDELDRFSSSDYGGGKNAYDRIAERLFNEVFYRQENEDRARSDINNMKQTISTIERNLSSAKELQLKRELGDLLVERETLAELERELVQDIAVFKEGYERRKRNTVQYNNEDESQKIRDLKRRKEQIDVERVRMKNNLEKAGKGDWKGIERDSTTLLRDAQAKKAKALIYSQNPYDLESLKAKISKGTEKVKDLRRDREELLKYEVMNKNSNLHVQQEDLAEKMQNYLNEIERSGLSAIDKADKMRRFREKISRFLNEDGVIDPSNHHKALDLIQELQQKYRLPPKSYEPSLQVSPRPNVSDSRHHAHSYSVSHGNNEDFMNSGFRDISLPNINPGKLTDEGLLLSKYQSQEKEMRRALNFLSTDSELYRQTLLQILELTQVMSQLEKVVEEQRLQKEWELERGQGERADYAKMKRDVVARLRKNVFGEENIPTLTPDTELNEADMKKEIAARLRRNAFGEVETKGYDRNIGFNIIFELVSGLARKYAYCQVVYAVYRKGEMITTPKMVEPHKCRTGQGFHNECVLNEMYTVFDVSPSMDAMVIFEFQCLFEAGIQNQAKPEAVGWTMIDLFDMMKLLKKGKWRLPVYFKPTNVNITIDRIRKLKRVKDVWFYLRLILPTDEETAENKTLEEMAHEYEIPQMHKRYWNETNPPPEDHQDEKENLKFEVDIKAILQSNKTKEEKKKGVEQKDIFKELFEEEKQQKGDQEEKFERYNPNDDYKQKMEPNGFNFMDELAKAERQEQVVAVNKKDLDLSVDFEYYKGLKLTVVGLRNFSINSKFKITGGLMNGDEFILDENARDCVFATKSRVMDDLFAYKRARSNTMGLNDSNEDSGELEETAVFNEDFYFLRDLPGLITMKKNELDILLVLQVVAIDYGTDKPKKKKKKKTKVMANSDEEIKEDEGQGELAAAKRNIDDAYEFVSWHVVKLNMSNGKLTRGRFIESLYDPPMFKPPFIGKKLVKTGAKIEFVIEEYLYDAGMLRKHKRNQKKKAEEEKPKPMPKSDKKPVYKDPYEEGTSKGPKIQVRLKPFLENTKKQYPDRTFEKGNGIDFYVDGARFLPDNVTVSKITFNVLAQDGSTIVKAQYGLPELGTPSYSPGFKMKAELRTNYFSPTCIALISLETIDSSNGQVRVVGYSAINLFVDGQTRQPPTSDVDGEAILIEGAYQIPIHCQEPNITKPFTLDKITKLDKIPCASLLVRIARAPLTADGLVVLSKSSVPEKDWEAKGVMISPPAYTGGHYNTEMIRVTDLERTLFSLRQERIDQTVKQKAVSLMERDGIQNPSDAEILRWIDNKLVKLNSTELLDMTYFSRYIPEFGFKITIDGFHNAPEKVPYVCISCLNPPGALYQAPPQLNDVYLTSKINWESPLTTPQFIEEYYSFYDLSVKKNLTFLMEVRTVSFGKKDAPTIKTIGWTALPIFNSNGYVQSGCYQLPIFKGSIPRDLLEYITHNEAWPHLMELISMKKSPIQLLEPMSAVVRLVDGQRDGHFQKPFDYGRMNYKYLAKPKAHLYMYTAAVETKLKGAKKLSSILPKKVTAEEYNDKITMTFKDNLL